MSINWEELHTYEDWASTLKDLLDNTRKALEKNDSVARGAAKRDLITFIDESPNWLIRNLDDVADEAIKDLGKADINEAITGIENRTVELIRLTKSVQSIAEDAKDAASSLRLRKSRRVVDSSTNVVNAIKELRTELDSTGKDKKLETLASTAIKAIQDLRAAIELS
ncbi:MAG: hypothetical protein NT179_09500 [Nitrospirae bacterium]|nr:hypothetical protein [Nitrospirota bacterium]